MSPFFLLVLLSLSFSALPNLAIGKPTSNGTTLNKPKPPALPVPVRPTSNGTTLTPKPGTKKQVSGSGAKCGEPISLVLDLPESINPRLVKEEALIRGSDGVYILAKAKVSSNTISVPLIIDPSIESDKISIEVKLNNPEQVFSQDFVVSKDSTELMVRKEGKSLTLISTSQSIDTDEIFISGYLLSQNAETPKVSRIIGTVTEVEGQKVINISTLKELNSGEHTIILQSSGVRYFAKIKN